MLARVCALWSAQARDHPHSSDDAAPSWSTSTPLACWRPRRTSATPRWGQHRLGKALTEAREGYAKIVRGAKKAEMLAFLTKLGIFGYEGTKAGSLRTRCEIAIGEMMCPKVFVNAAPNEYKCSCGHVGPATFNGRAPKCGGEGCTKPSYAMTLTAILAKRVA